MEYAFTLEYLLPRDGPDREACVERLGAAGCDDVLVGTGLPGRIALEFTREAPDAQQALASALRDVRSGIWPICSNGWSSAALIGSMRD